MKVTIFFSSALLFVLGSLSAGASSQNLQSVPLSVPEVDADTSGLDELNPFDPNVEQTLQILDLFYEFQTGESAHLPTDRRQFLRECYRQTCTVWIRVDRSSQTADLYLNGNRAYTWLVSTGAPGFETPDFDTHPNGRIYDRYTSTKYPGGDWNGMGNMPYAVFIKGGFAIHGTGQANWPKLGKKASHGCIRLHPDYGFTFNRLVRKYGIYDTWITVQ